MAAFNHNAECSSCAAGPAAGLHQMVLSCDARILLPIIECVVTPGTTAWSDKHTPNRTDGSWLCSPNGESQPKICWPSYERVHQPCRGLLMFREAMLQEDDGHTFR